MNSVIVTFLVIEVFIDRWIQLSEKEKKEIRTYNSIKSKFLVFFNAIKITFEKINIKNLKSNSIAENLPSKKWVRSEKKDSNTNSEKVKV